MIESDDTKYYYDLLSSSQTFPLQFGNGTYFAAIFEQQENGKYIHINSLSFELKLENHDTVYLSSNEIVSWEDDSISTILAHEITKNLTSDTEKVNAIHDYIIENIKYDEGKINSLDSTYLPNLDYIISSKSGICYDYASLFAAMSRSLNIPTKLIKGYKNDISSYHAWNQVYLNDEWITIDATYNATLFENQFETTLIMNSHDYSNKKNLLKYWINYGVVQNINKLIISIKSFTDFMLYLF